MRRSWILVCLAVFCFAGGAGAVELVDTGPAGQGQPFDNRQPQLGINYIVRTGGLYQEIGQISAFAGSFAPSGWAFANGQQLPINQNQALFSKLGITYGGDGKSWFALPDLRGRTATHAGSQYLVGQASGADQFALSHKQMPSHQHTIPLDPFQTSPEGLGMAMDNHMPSLAVNYQVVVNGPSPDPNQGLNDLPFLGEVRMYASPWQHLHFNNTLPTDGQRLSIDHNIPLHAILFDNFGGDDHIFALPDLRDTTVMGVGQGQGLTARNLGDRVGIGHLSLQESHLPEHVHELAEGGTFTGPAGEGDPFDNMQPTSTLRWLINVRGLFPTMGGAGSSDYAFLGQMTMFAGEDIPFGWLPAEGQILPINQNQALYSVMGTAYGGDGRVTFALPDLRGRVPVGAGGEWNLLGRSLGLEQVTLTGENLPSHTHGYVVPEPATLGLLAISAVGLVRRRRLRSTGR